MSERPQRILVAVAWPYANGPRHIGHVAGFGVPSDIFARYHRLKGNEVLMVSGTDEHGTPIMVPADREGVSPRELVDRNSAIIRDDLRRLGLSYDLFTRTTTRNHHRVVRDVFRTLHDRGCLVERTTSGAFSAATGQALPDRYIEGNLPDLRLPRRARRSVRQLRQPARPTGPHRAALEDRRSAARLPQDTDFAWEEFVRRNNDELVATWGNLVNRTLQSAFRHFGAVPEAAELQAADRAVPAEVEAGFETVGGEIEKARFRSALAEAMTLAGRVNRYLSAQAPWAVLESDRARAGTILHVALRCIDNVKLLLTPFLLHSSQRLHRLLGHEGWLAGPLEVRDVVEPDGDVHTVLTGEYETWVGRWEPSRLEPGQALRQPSPLFAKLDRATVVRAELERMGRTAS